VTAYLLVTLLHRRARRKTAYAGGARRLLAELAEVRCCRLIDNTGRKGRPRVRLQIEEMGEGQKILAPSSGRRADDRLTARGISRPPGYLLRPMIVPALLLKL